MSEEDTAVGCRVRVYRIADRRRFYDTYCSGNTEYGNVFLMGSRPECRAVEMHCVYVALAGDTSTK